MDSMIKVGTSVNIKRTDGECHKTPRHLFFSFSIFYSFLGVTKCMVSSSPPHSPSCWCAFGATSSCYSTPNGRFVVDSVSPTRPTYGGPCTTCVGPKQMPTHSHTHSLTATDINHDLQLSLQRRPLEGGGGVPKEEISVENVTRSRFHCHFVHACISECDAYGQTVTHCCFPVSIRMAFDYRNITHSNVNSHFRCNHNSV